jgi:hypothetical protein
MWYGPYTVYTCMLLAQKQWIATARGTSRYLDKFCFLVAKIFFSVKKDLPESTCTNQVPTVLYLLQVLFHACLSKSRQCDDFLRVLLLNAAFCDWLQVFERHPSFELFRPAGMHSRNGSLDHPFLPSAAICHQSLLPAITHSIH